MAAEHADKLAAADGPEYRIMANTLGFFLALAGLLVGTMFKERDLEYWMSDLVPLIILFYCGYKVYRDAIDLTRESAIYEMKKQQVEAVIARAASINKVHDEMSPPKLTAKPEFSEEQVIDAVTRKIQENRSASSKK